MRGGGLDDSKHNGKTLKDVGRVACSVSHFKRSSVGNSLEGSVGRSEETGLESGYSHR